MGHLPHDTGFAEPFLPHALTSPTELTGHLPHDSHRTPAARMEIADLEVAVHQHVLVSIRVDCHNVPHPPCEVALLSPTLQLHESRPPDVRNRLSSKAAVFEQKPWPNSGRLHLRTFVIFFPPV